MDAVTRRALLDRLCQVCTEILGCEFAGIWMLDENAGAFVPAAANSPEDWEQIRDMHLPREALRPFVDAPAPDGAGLFWTDGPPRRALPAALGRIQRGSALVLTLRRGGALVGTVVCGYRRAGVLWS